MKKIIPCIIVLFTLYSCNTIKDVVYLQGSGNSIEFNVNDKASCSDVNLKSGDLLYINVNTIIPEAALPFNSITSAGKEGIQNYLIDIDGYINYPIIGKLHAAGMTKNEFINLLKTKLYPKFISEEPIINVRLLNFKFSVLGEVNQSGIFQVENEKLDLFEAISMAGDLTLYGRRDNVLLIRQDESGLKKTYRLDLRNKELLNSPFYYLQQNDILYIQPNKPRSRGAALGVVETLTISLLGTLISITSLVVNIFK